MQLDRGGAVDRSPDPAELHPDVGMAVDPVTQVAAAACDAAGGAA